jgi:hypothetical protein
MNLQRGHMREIGKHQFHVAHHRAQLAYLLMPTRQELVQQAQLVHDLQGRRVHRDTPKIAQKISVLFQHQHRHPGARQQQPQHHAARAAARDAATCVQ